MKGNSTKRKIIFLYPAIFIKDEDGEIQAIFPDLNIYTNGKTITEAYLSAENLLFVYFSYAIKYETEYTKPSKIEEIVSKCKNNEIAMLVEATIEVEV